jgi:hypothetical protein
MAISIGEIGKKMTLTLIFQRRIPFLKGKSDRSMPESQKLLKGLLKELTLLSL